MATVKPTPAKSQLAAVKKAEAQRAAQQQAAQQRAAQQRAAAQRAAAQQAAQERAQRAAQLQAAAQAQQRAAAQQAAQQRALQAAQERAQRAATMTGMQQRAQGSPGMLPAALQIPGALQADQERAQRAATMTGGEIPGPRRPLNPFTTDSFPQQTGSGIQSQGFDGYGFDSALVDYLNSQKRLSATDGGISYTYDPGTQAFTGYTRSGPVTKTLAQIQAEAASRPPVMSYRGMQQPIQGLGSFPGMQQPIQGLGSFPGMQQPIQGLGSFPGNLPPRDIGIGGPPPGFTGPRGLPSGAPPQQVEPFRPIEGMAGNLVGGFTPPPPPNQAGQLIGLGGQPQQYLMEQQRVMDVTQGSSAYPPSFMPGQGVMNAGLGFGQAMGAPAVPQQSPTQAAFMQATQYNPRNQLNMFSNMQQPAQNQSTGFGQSNMFSNMQQPAPMQSNMNAGMGQNLSNAVGQTSANLFGGGPSASATQQQRQQQQPGPARTGGVF